MIHIYIKRKMTQQLNKIQQYNIIESATHLEKYKFQKYLDELKEA